MNDELAAALAGDHPIGDHVFDRLFPQAVRFRSGIHWTPLEVARRAVAWLAPDDTARVLDLGAGVGKLCLVGALTTRARWSGIERDAVMVRAARAAAEQLGLGARVTFALGDIAAVDWASHDAFYLFNPFAEALFAGAAATREDDYVAHLDAVYRNLEAARAGTRVVTYHGFGGNKDLDGYDLVQREPAREDELCLWIRR